LAYDLVGFQTATDLRSFRDYVVQELRDGQIDADGRITALGQTRWRRPFRLELILWPLENSPTRLLRDNIGAGCSQAWLVDL
jgi:hypothetical protein